MLECHYFGFKTALNIGHPAGTEQSEVAIVSIILFSSRILCAGGLVLLDRKSGKEVTHSALLAVFTGDWRDEGRILLR